MDIIKPIYIVYRTYTPQEVPNIEERTVVVGWTEHSEVLKAFIAQRSSDKYKYKRFNKEETSRLLEKEIYLLDYDNEINCVRLQSAQTGEEILFFTTSMELKQIEQKIQKFFAELSSLERIPGNADYLKMIINLKSIYFEALDYIGYRPKELSSLYPNEYASTEIDEINDNIASVYDAMSLSSAHISREFEGPPGQVNISDYAKQIIYSIESVIKVYGNDL